METTEDDYLLAGYEAVYTVTDYYDGSLLIDPDTLQLAMEDWDIGRRQELAFHTGKARLT